MAMLASSLWHDRLGHPGPSILHFLGKNKMIECTNRPRSSVSCQSCVLGKTVKMPFVSSNSVTLFPFDIIHSDLWTSPVLSSSGHKYYVLFLDDYSNFLWTFPLMHKSDVIRIFTSFHAYVRTQFERSIKCIQCDNGGEFANRRFWELCQSQGISFRFSCPHTSSQNGKAERKIRSINNIMRTLLLHASLPPSFWPHALQMATYLINILPSHLLKHESPLKILYHKDPSYSHLRVFGCLCYPLFPSTTIHKLQPRSTPCVFLGFPTNHRGYKCYDISSGKIIISRHVRFDESRFPFSELNTNPSTTYDFLDNGLDPSIWHYFHNQTQPDQTASLQPTTTPTPPSSSSRPAVQLPLQPQSP